MSYEISYKHLAVRFPIETLQAALPNGFFFEDQFMLLELHGSNNCTTSHPITGREVCERSWSVLAFNQACYVIKEAVKFSSSCETGGLRMTGKRNTTPETYIRAVRNTMKSAISPEMLISSGFSIVTRLEAGLQPGSDQGAIQSINEWVPCIENDGQNPHWILYPLANLLHAAILIRYGCYVDQRPTHYIFSVDGPCFPGEAPELFKHSNLGIFD